MKVKDLLTDETKWTKHAMYRRENGVATYYRNHAYSFCLVGAVNFCYDVEGDNEGIVYKILNRIHAQLLRLGFSDTVGVGTWNDMEDRRFEEVKELVTELDI